MQVPDFLTKFVQFIFPGDIDLSVVMNMSFSRKYATYLLYLVLENWEKVLEKSWKSPGIFLGSWCTNPVCIPPCFREQMQKWICMLGWKLLWISCQSILHYICDNIWYSTLFLYSGIQKVWGDFCYKISIVW